jgi:Holliday junction resolvasome RuvABC endonuclease subunit
VPAQLRAKAREHAPPHIKLAVIGHRATMKEQGGRMVKSAFGLSDEFPRDKADTTAMTLRHDYTARCDRRRRTSATASPNAPRPRP